MTNLLDLDNDILNIVDDSVKQDNADRIEKEIEETRKKSIFERVDN